MHSQIQGAIINLMKGFPEHRITSNKFKDNGSGEKKQAFFEIYYKFSNDFIITKIRRRDFPAGLAL
jgi:hypothetical protein